MELRHLRYFVAVAELENVSRAALKLHVSQPGLSRQVRDLEAELGFALLVRSARSVRLTEAGKSFLKEARAVLQRVEEAVKTARVVATGGSVELHIGYAPSPTVRLLPATLRLFQSDSPNVRVRLHDLSTEEMLAGIREGQLQLAFLVRPNPARLRRLHFEALTEEAVCLALAPRHPLARMRLVPLAQAAREPLIAFTRKDYPEYHDYLEVMFGGMKNAIQIAEEHDSASSMIAAIESGAGVGVVPRSFGCSAGPRLKLVPLSPEPSPLAIGGLWRKKGLSPVAQRFWKAAQTTAARQNP